MSPVLLEIATKFVKEIVDIRPRQRGGGLVSPRLMAPASGEEQNVENSERLSELVEKAAQKLDLARRGVNHKPLGSRRLLRAQMFG